LIATILLYLETIELWLFLQTVEQLLNRRVVGIEGFEVGDIKDFEVEIGTWNVTRLIVALSDKAIAELGLKKRFLAPRACIPISAITYSADNVLLNKPLQELYEGDSVISECAREAFL
jgi:sporulation protein YlmC with PRC-barrel domain